MEVLADGIVGFAQERVGFGALDSVQMPLHRQRLPVEEIAAAIRAVERDLVGAEDEAGEGVPRIRDARHVAPGVRAVAGVDANAVAVDAAHQLAHLFIARRAAGVAENELIGGERDRFTDGVRRDPFRKGCCCDTGGLRGGGLEDRLAELLHPRILGGASAGLTFEQVMFLQQLRQQGARLAQRGVLLPALGLHAITHGLAQHRACVFATDEPEQIPRAIREHDAMDLGLILHGVKQIVERLVRGFLRARGENFLGQGHILGMHGIRQSLRGAARESR